MACEEYEQLFYAYLDAVEEAKRKAQPWECEVTVIPQGDEVRSPPLRFRWPRCRTVTKSGFSCDEPE